MQTTLYNHRPAASGDKPLIPNVIYKSLLILLEMKDIDACNYILDCYSLTSFQKELYQFKLKEQKTIKQTE